MGYVWHIIFLACLSVFPFHLAFAASTEQVHLPGGEFTPQFGVSQTGEALAVAPYFLDSRPVTNRDYLAFVRAENHWNKERVAALLADSNYLKHWTKQKQEWLPLEKQLDAPVTNLSWFAANDYCIWRGMRLPSVLEWEFAAAADEERPNASKDPLFVQRLLEWYSRPNTGGELPQVQQGKPNYWGVFDLHGLIWEWTADFNSIFVAGDNRRDAEALKNLFCGASSLNSTDKANYAAYMRYALRNSLRANYTMEALGFRCARNEEPDPEAK